MQRVLLATRGWSHCGNARSSPGCSAVARRSSTRIESSIGNIHPTAVIHEGAQVSKSAIVGPFCVVGEGVKIGRNCHIKSYVNIQGDTVISDGCMFFPFSSVGEIPQDKKYDGEHTSLYVGENTVVRESVTINTGTEQGGGLTRVGAGCLIMASTHVGHDCIIGDNVIVSNGSALAGHVRVDDHVIIGGLCGIRQHVHIGTRAMVGGGAVVDRHVLPYSLVTGNRAQLRGVNLVGLRRAGIPRETIQALLRTFRFLFPDTLGKQSSSFASPWTFPTSTSIPVELHLRCGLLLDAMEHGLIPSCDLMAHVIDFVMKGDGKGERT
jgi:UDP-N-acetylglucosamine acyltransferase